MLLEFQKMEQDALWNFMQTEAAQSFWGAAPRLSWIVRQIPRGAKVLNIGIGDGTFEVFALKRGLLAHSLDPSRTAVERMNRQHSGQVQAQTGRAEAIPWDGGAFDAVVMTEVLEHLGDDVLESALREVARVLKPSGFFLGTVPAREDLSLNATVCPECGHAFHRWGHVRAFEATSLEETLRHVFSEVHIHEHLFSPWVDLNPRYLIENMLRRSRSQGVVGKEFLRWTQRNWRSLLSSAPRLAAHRLGVRFPHTNWVFRASGADGNRGSRLAPGVETVSEVT